MKKIWMGSRPTDRASLRFSRKLIKSDPPYKQHAYEVISSSPSRSKQATSSIVQTNFTIDTHACTGRHRQAIVPIFEPLLRRWPKSEQHLVNCPRRMLTYALILWAAANPITAATVAGVMNTRKIRTTDINDDSGAVELTPGKGCVPTYPVQIF